MAELPSRFVRMNLYPNPNADRVKEQNYFIGAAVTSERYKQDYRAGDEYKLRATVDRRIRNPLAMGCSRGAIERLYGVEKYDEWRGTGTWLNMTDDVALSLLRRKGDGAKP